MDVKIRLVNPDAGTALFGVTIRGGDKSITYIPMDRQTLTALVDAGSTMLRDDSYLEVKR